MKPISIEVNDLAVERYANMSEAGKQIISEEVSRILNDKRSLRENMDDMGRQV